jgi:hypothetical protein
MCHELGCPADSPVLADKQIGDVARDLYGLSGRAVEIWADREDEIARILDLADDRARSRRRASQGLDLNTAIGSATRC